MKYFYFARNYLNIIVSPICPFAINYVTVAIITKFLKTVKFLKKNIWSDRISQYIYTPCNGVRGVYWNHHVRLSVRLSSAFGFPAHNCFPFTPIIMKLHMQTPHESRMCHIDFEVKRSKVKVTMVSGA